MPSKQENATSVESAASGLTRRSDVLLKAVRGTAVTQGLGAWIARKVLVWALGDHSPFLDPLTIDPLAFERIERALRRRLNEPVRADFLLLAREILQAPDPIARQMAVGRLLAVQINELKIARATAFVLGQTFREVREEKEGKR